MNFIILHPITGKLDAGLRLFSGIEASEEIGKDIKEAYSLSQKLKTSSREIIPFTLAGIFTWVIRNNFQTPV
ncbi:MAG: hypothetical protein R2824_02375 [Saprospiraceae bacterium]|nr:hypothetical protein [Lewinella sp.]